MAREISIGDPAITVELRRNSRARRLILRVPPNGRRPALTLPQDVPVDAAVDFLTRNHAWLEERLAKRPPRIQVCDRIILPFRSGHLRLRHQSSGKLREEGGELFVPGKVEHLPVRVAAFLREEARKTIAAETALRAEQLGRRFGRLSLRDTKSRWGSCTSAGDLMFSWRLIMAPEAVLRYVVAHEVAHLAEMNHSPKFWNTVQRLCPGFEAQRKWLQTSGAALHAYDFTAA